MDAALVALRALGFGADKADEKIGWRGVVPAPTTNDHFRCEFCAAENLDTTEIDHSDGCPVALARACFAVGGQP